MNTALRMVRVRHPPHRHPARPCDWNELENYQPGSSPAEVVLTIGWGAVSRIDLEPATCGDPQCEADHGFTGSSTNDDLGLRVSSAADGGTVVDQMLAFARALSNASGERLR